MRSRNSALAAFYTELWSLVDGFFSENRWDRLDEPSTLQHGIEEAYRRLNSVVEIGGEDGVSREAHRDLRVTTEHLESFLEWARSMGSSPAHLNEKVVVFWKYLQFMAIHYASRIELEHQELPGVLAERRREALEERMRLVEQGAGEATQSTGQLQSLG